MSEAIHEITHESTHHAAHAGGSAKLIGLLISVLALFLAVSEMLGKSAQTHGLGLNIEVSDTWNFFQAKSIRQTIVRTAIEKTKIESGGDREAADKQVSAWQSTIDRLESDAKSNEGRKELAVKAKHLEHERDAFLSQYHAYEIASLFLQLGIVLASVALLSSIMTFALGSIALGAGGLAILAGTYFHLPFVAALLH